MNVLIGRLDELTLILHNRTVILCWANWGYRKLQHSDSCCILANDNEINESICFQLFDDYHLFRRSDLSKWTEETQLSKEINRKLDLESKVTCAYITFWHYVRTCLSQCPSVKAVIISLMPYFKSFHSVTMSVTAMWLYLYGSGNFEVFCQCQICLEKPGQMPDYCN